MLSAKLVATCFALIWVSGIDCGINTKLWKKCRCKLLEWTTWGDCDAECNGSRRRTRDIRMASNKRGCPFTWTTCLSSGMGSDYSRCNSFCYNGGTSDSYSCTCVHGSFGGCCEHKVSCAHPGSLSNGGVRGSTYTYGGEVRYYCNSGYKLVSGNTRRRCEALTTSGYWSGSKPKCAYYVSCNSGPCKNSATCTNIPNSYRCRCTTGWAGKQCTDDIQTPEVSNCPVNKDLKATDLMLDVDWITPTFWDPHGNIVEVSSNYPSNSWVFPWGDFTVSYSAFKPNNGLRKECVFSIKIRPNPCGPLTPPLNGAIICNNWKTDFGRVCLELCHVNYTVPRGIFPNQWYLCVSVGSWMPSDDTTKCSVDVRGLPPNNPYNIGFSFKSCQDNLSAMQAYYLKELKKSPFKFLCDKFSDECIEHNVLVLCR